MKVTIVRTLLFATTLMTFPPPLAEAGEKRLFANIGVVSSLYDRGEQIGREVLEFEAGLEIEIQETTVYGAFYRLLPVGSEQDAFDDEADFILGVVWQGSGFSADVSANWLTFPGEETQSSLELAGGITLDAAFSPTLTGFYDTDLEDRGFQLAAGPEWYAGLWTLYALGHAGFVHRGDGSAHRSYAGFEIGAARPVSKSVDIGLFVRADAADEDTFARRIERGSVTTLGNSGIAAGIGLSVSR
jgi:hypothetical protein